MKRVTEQPKDLDLESDWKAIQPTQRGGRANKAKMLGKVFGRLEVVAGAGTDRHGASLWRCLCVCGTEKVVSRGALKGGRVKSCGCLLAEYKRAPKAHLGHTPKSRGTSQWQGGVDSVGMQQSLDRVQGDIARQRRSALAEQVERARQDPDYSVVTRYGDPDIDNFLDSIG